MFEPEPPARVPVPPLSGSPRGRWEEFARPEDVPLHSLVPLAGPGGEPLGAYRGVRREDTGQIISVVSTRYGLVGHRDVARAVHRIGATLGPPAGPGPLELPRESIRLYAGGRRMEVKLVVGRRFPLAAGDDLYPGIRVYNSLDGSWAVRFSGFALRLACCNQLCAERGDLLEWRELHLSTGADLMARLEAVIHEFLGRFGSVLDLYRRAMGEELLAAEVAARLEQEGMPGAHAQRIGARAEVAASHVALLSRWTAYQIATAYLTREVSVNPDRERRFERSAARALLLPTPGSDPP